MKPVSEEGKSYGVLDEDGVVFRTDDEWLLMTQYQPVILHRTPRLNFTDADVAILVWPVCGYTTASLRTMAIKNI